MNNCGKRLAHGIIVLICILHNLVSGALAQPDAEAEFNKTLVTSAVEQTRQTLFYDPSYVKIPYPGGDVSIDRGVCSDVIIRCFRKVGIDLQKDVHEDMKCSFQAYPKKWGLNKTDTNIDHRRVYNLMCFFSRNNKNIPIDSADRFLPGDIVAWRLDNGHPHIGLVTDQTTVSGTPLMVHNIGLGARLEDVLHEWKIIGHYRWFK